MSALNLFGLGFALTYNLPIPWLIVCLIWFVFYISRIRFYIRTLPMAIGYANWVTIFRLSIIITAFGFYQSLGEITLFLFFLTAICLDGVDGYLARKFDHSSNVGGNLDMEVDSFLVLVLSWIHVNGENLDWWVLIPGGARYGYELFFFWTQKNKRELMPKKARATIAVFFFISLLLPFLTKNPFIIMATYISGALIIFSFLVSLLSQILDSKH